jgi:hypothetical protein
MQYTITTCDFCHRDITEKKTYFIKLAQQKLVADDDSVYASEICYWCYLKIYQTTQQLKGEKK